MRNNFKVQKAIKELKEELLKMTPDERRALIVKYYDPELHQLLEHAGFSFDVEEITNPNPPQRFYCKCPLCDATGYGEDSDVCCKECNGKGVVFVDA